MIDSKIMLLLSIHLILIILGLFYKKSKFIYIIQCFWIIILYGYNSGGTDYLSNQNIFISAKPHIGLYDMLTDNLSYLMKLRGIDFIHYNLIIGTSLLIILFIFIRKITEGSNFVISLIMIYPFVEFVSQKRFFYCMILIIIALYFLNRRDKIGYISYALLVFLAMQFHQSAAIYFIFLIYFILPTKYRIKVFVFGTLACSVFYKYIPKILSDVVRTDKAELYFVTLAESSSFIKFIFWAALHICYIWLFRMFCKSQLKTENYELCKKVMDYNYISLAFIPFYNFDPVFFRLYRAIIIWNYICLSKYVVHRRHYITNNKLKYILLQTSLCIFTFVVFYVMVGIGFDLQVLSIFKYNELLNKMF